MIGRTVAVIGLLAVVLVMVGSGGTAAQPEAPNATAQVVDDQVMLTDWEYEDGTFVLTFDTDVPREIVITEAVSTQQAQAGGLSIERTTLARGESTVKMPTQRGPGGEAAVTIASRQGTRQGRAVFVSTGQSGHESDVSPFAGTSSTAGWLGGAALSLLAVVLAGVYKMRTEATEPEVAG